MQEAEERCERSVGILQARDIPFLDNLPLIETCEEVTIRAKADIIARARCLIVLALGAIEGDLTSARADIQHWHLREALTLDETRFLAADVMSERDRINFSWRIEAAVPLMWAAGLHDVLYFPDRQAGPEALGAYLRSLTPNMMIEAQMPSVAEILNEADLIYRLHWATRQAEIDDREMPGGLNWGVVQERHQALNWLISYDDNADWDDVTTDT